MFSSGAPVTKLLDFLGVDLQEDSLKQYHLNRSCGENSYSLCHYNAGTFYRILFIMSFLLAQPLLRGIFARLTLSSGGEHRFSAPVCRCVAFFSTLLCPVTLFCCGWRLFTKLRRLLVGGYGQELCSHPALAKAAYAR